MDITVNKLDDKYSLFNIKFLPIKSSEQIKTNIRYIFVIDNSGSIGDYTKILTNIIIRV